MGMLSSLLPGLRDLRTPLTAGYSWLIALWLLFSHVEPLRELANRLRDEFEPITAAYGGAAAIAASSVVAYLLGSLVTANASSTRLNRIEWFLAFPVAPLISRYAFWQEKDTSDESDPDLNRLSRWRRVRALDLQRLERFYFPDSGHLSSEALYDNPVSGEPAGRLVRYFYFDLAYARLTDEVGEEESDFSTDYSSREGFFDTLDVQSDGVRLHIQNKELWDQYDRLNAEAELRLTMCYPLLIGSFGVGWRGAWWAGVLLLLVTWALYRDGDGRARAALNVLITALVTKVIEDPELASYASNATGEHDDILNRARIRQEQEDREAWGDSIDDDAQVESD